MNSSSVSLGRAPEERPLRQVPRVRKVWLLEYPRIAQ